MKTLLLTVLAAIAVTPSLFADHAAGPPGSKPRPVADGKVDTEKQVRKLIVDLQEDDFDTRMSAKASLLKLAGNAVNSPLLQRSLAPFLDGPDHDMRDHARNILTKAARPVSKTDVYNHALRAIREVPAVKDARDLLDSLFDAMKKEEVAAYSKERAKRDDAWKKVQEARDGLLKDSENQKLIAEIDAQEVRIATAHENMGKIYLEVMRGMRLNMRNGVDGWVVRRNGKDFHLSIRDGEVIIQGVTRQGEGASSAVGFDLAAGWPPGLWRFPNGKLQSSGPLRFETQLRSMSGDPLSRNYYSMYTADGNLSQNLGIHLGSHLSDIFRDHDYVGEIRDVSIQSNRRR